MTKATVKQMETIRANQERMSKLHRLAQECATLPRVCDFGNQTKQESMASKTSMSALKRAYATTKDSFGEMFYPSVNNPIFEDLKQSAHEYIQMGINDISMGILNPAIIKKLVKDNIIIEDIVNITDEERETILYHYAYIGINAFIRNERSRGMTGNVNEIYKLGFVTIDSDGVEQIHDTRYEMRHCELGIAIQQVLTQKQYRVFNYKYILDYTQEKIAECMNVHQTTVGRWLIEIESIIADLKDIRK